MPVYDSSAREIVARLQAASEEEGAAIKRLNAALSAELASGQRDEAQLLQLTREMEDAHNVKMRVYRELQAFRLDKS